MKNLIQLLFLSLFVLFVTACGGDDVDCEDALQNPNILSAEISALTTAAVNYYTDQSDANCQAYKDAIQGFLDEAKKYDDCFEGTADQQDYRESILEAESEIDDLGC